MRDTLLIIWGIGAVLAFCYAAFDAHCKQKEGKDVTQYPMAISYLTGLSWLYIVAEVYYYIKKRST